MKFLPILAVGLLVVAVTALDKEEAKEMFRNMSQECKEQEKATDADVETMVNENYPETKEGKCLVACMQETFGIVSWFLGSCIHFLPKILSQIQDKKFSKEGFMSVASMVNPVFNFIRHKSFRLKTDPIKY